MRFSEASEGASGSPSGYFIFSQQWIILSHPPYGHPPPTGRSPIDASHRRLGLPGLRPPKLTADNSPRLRMLSRPSRGLPGFDPPKTDLSRPKVLPLRSGGYPALECDISKSLRRIFSEHLGMFHPGNLKTSVVEGLEILWAASSFPSSGLFRHPQHLHPEGVTLPYKFSS